MWMGTFMRCGLLQVLKCTLFASFSGIITKNIWMPNKLSELLSIFWNETEKKTTNSQFYPGMMYYFLSTVADVSTNVHINASAVYFSPNTSYSPSYLGFFNKTFPLFAPRTYRADDFNDPIHLERISTLNTFIVQDLGAVKPNTSEDYTSGYYRINEWY